MDISSTGAGMPRRGFLIGSAAAVGAVATAGIGVSGCANFTGSRPGPSDFSFTFWGSQVEKQVVSTVITEFCGPEGLIGRPLHVPGDYNTKINTLIASGTPPDGGYLGGGTAMTFAAEGLVENVAGQDGFDDILPQAVHYYAPGQAITKSCLEATGLWFDRAVVSEAGVRPPQRPEEAWTFDQLVENATRLTVDGEGRRPDESGFDVRTVQRYGVAAPTGLLPLQGLLISNGIELFSDDGTRCNIADARAIEVIQSVADLIFEHRVSPTPAQAATFGSNSGLLLASGRVAMLIDGQWCLLDLAATELDYDVGVLPGFGGPYTVMITSGASVVFAGTRHRKVATSLILQAMADPRSVSLYRSGLWMPMREQFYATEEGIAAWLDDEVHPPGYRTAILEPTFRQARSEPSYRMRNSDLIMTRLNASVSAMFTKPMDIAAACRAAAARVGPMLRGAFRDLADEQ